MRTLDNHELTDVSGGLVQPSSGWGDPLDQSGGMVDPLAGMFVQLTGNDPSCSPNFVGPPSPSCTTPGSEPATGSAGKYCAQAASIQEFCAILGLLTVPALFTPIGASVATVCVPAAGAATIYTLSQCP